LYRTALTASRQPTVGG